VVADGHSKLKGHDVQHREEWRYWTSEDVKRQKDSKKTIHIHTLIHFRSLYSAASRNLLSGAPSQATAKVKWLKRFIESRQIIPEHA